MEKSIQCMKFLLMEYANHEVIIAGDFNLRGLGQNCKLSTLAATFQAHLEQFSLISVKQHWEEIEGITNNQKTYRDISTIDYVICSRGLINCLSILFGYKQVE